MSEPIARLISAQQRRGRIGRYVLRQILALFGFEIPASVVIGGDLRVPHRVGGVVIHANTVIGRHVTIYQNVTIGRADPWVPTGGRVFSPVVIGDDAVLCAGSVVIGDEAGLRVGVGTVVAANSVLTESTGDWEVWAGMPARRVGPRRDATPVRTVHQPPAAPVRAPADGK